MTEISGFFPPEMSAQIIYPLYYTERGEAKRREVGKEKEEEDKSNG